MQGAAWRLQLRAGQVVGSKARFHAVRYSFVDTSTQGEMLIKA